MLNQGLLSSLIITSQCCTVARAQTPGRRTADASLSGGPDGRGWGGAVADDCSLGVVAEHPNELGFRVTMRTWAKGARLRWQFDHAVSLAKQWGPVKVLPHADLDANPSMISFMLRGSTRPRTSPRQSKRRTDQWGFILTQPYHGRWSISCQIPSPPSPAPRAPNFTITVAADKISHSEPSSLHTRVRPETYSFRASAVMTRAARYVISTLLGSFGTDTRNSSSTRNEETTGHQTGRRGRGQHRRRRRGRAWKRDGRRKRDDTQE